MKIIIIDDEPKSRKGLGKILNMHPGWTVLDTFAEGESAIRFLTENPVDVVITDIHMPGMTGLDMIARIRETNKKLSFVILSGYGRFEYAQRAIDLGVKKFLMKPTSPEEVTQALEQIESEMTDRAPSILAQKPTNNLVIMRAKEYIDLNYRKKFTLTDMANALYISPNYLSDLFKKHTGMKFSDYLLEVRMEKSKEYLMDIQYKVGDISALVGFSDARYFSSTFRKRYGMSPLEFRNRYAAGLMSGESDQP
ncbi:MAG: response regulator [Oscillospiraceae bacterium]|nr:response regulator [Oscillospiraceae bacterium]